MSPNCARRWPSRTRFIEGGSKKGVRPLASTKQIYSNGGCEGSDPRQRRDPMKANALKKKIADGVNCVGGWAAIPDPFACEVYAAQGWDSVTIDMQHGAGNINDAVPMLVAIQSAGDATPLVRVPWNDPGQIMRALDAGAMGIICPMINTKAEA